MTSLKMTKEENLQKICLRIITVWISLWITLCKERRLKKLERKEKNIHLLWPCEWPIINWWQKCSNLNDNLTFTCGLQRKEVVVDYYLHFYHQLNQHSILPENLTLILFSFTIIYFYWKVKWGEREYDWKSFEIEVP